MAVHMVSVNFGVGSTITGVTGSFQRRDHDKISEVESVRNGSGTTVTRVYYDSHDEATFEYVLGDGTNNSPSASVSLPTVGNFLTVADSNYSELAASTWLIDHVASAATNVSSLRVTLRLSKWPGISS